MKRSLILIAILTLCSIVQSDSLDFQNFGDDFGNYLPIISGYLV